MYQNSKMKNLKILLTDPRHNTKGFHSRSIPINIGYIGEYLKAKIKNINIELKLAVEPNEIFELLKNWKPNILGCSNYVWNASLSYSMCEYLKEIDPNNLCVLGGPEFPAGTGATKITNTEMDQTYDKSFKYLLDRPAVDYFAYCDGEVAFIEIIKIFIENNFSIESMKNNNQPIEGNVSLSRDKTKLLVGNYINRIGMKGGVKSDGRDVIPSPYLSGLLDKFLDGTYTPAFETARGCPFLCAFCDQGLDKTKVTAFSTKRLADEMMYVGEKMSKIEAGTKTIHIFDNNWGLFQKDVDLADHILEVMDKYDWPGHIKCSTPKSKWENLLKINDKLKNRVSIGLSMQSANLDVLKIIKRKNWAMQQYIDFVQELRKRQKPVNSELIVPLPGETEESFFKGIEFLMDNKVQPSTYTLMVLCGAEFGKDKYIKDNKMKTKFRILPRQFGNYNGRKLFELEEVCIETSTMNFQSYLKCRNYNFILQMICHPIFSPIFDLTQKLGLSWYQFSKKLVDKVEDKNFKGDLKNLFNDFCEESYQELFDTREEAIEFYSKSENYNALVEEKKGSNLLTKYTGKSILIYENIIDTCFKILREHFKDNHDENLNYVFISSEKWLKNISLTKQILNENSNGSEGLVEENKYDLELKFDFPEWIKNKELKFDRFIKNTKYEIYYDYNRINEWKSHVTSFYKNDKILSQSRIVESLTGLASGTLGIKGSKDYGKEDKFSLLEKQFQKL